MTPSHLRRPEPDAMTDPAPDSSPAVEELLPLSFGQERLWFLHQLAPASPAYNLPMGLRLRGVLENEALERALSAVVARHEALRTTFRRSGTDLVQVVHEARPVKMHCVDLEGVPPAGRDEDLEIRLRDQAGLPFDLERGPLLRVTLFRMAERDHVLLAVFHHTVADGGSMGVFVRELAAHYRWLIEGGAGPADDLPIQYPDFALWQRERAGSPKAAAQLAWWKERLDGACPPLELPADRPRPPVPTMNGAREPCEVDEATVGDLKRLCRSEGATLYMLTLAAMAAWLHRCTGREEISVGSPVAGRNRAELEGLIGLFSNTLVMRTRVSRNDRFRELLRRTRELVLEAVEHEEVAFERLVRELQPERTLSIHPLFQVMLAFQGALPPEYHAGGLRLCPFEVDTGTAKFDLMIALTEREGRLSGAFEFNTDLFDRASARRWAGQFRRILRAVARDPDLRVAELPLLSEEERRQVLHEWNDTSLDYRRDQCAHEIFEEQAARTPDATALVWGEERITYAQLNRRADRLAGRLRGLGVGPEVLVGIHLERTPVMVAALLAVLKAGGAYVPLDPAHPRDRLSFIIEDARLAVVITERGLTGTLPAAGVRLLDVDAHGDGASVGSAASDRPAAAEDGVAADNLAYVLYTSGSTGQPKGVAVEHRSVAALIAWARHTYPVEELRGVLASTSICFDLSVFEIFVPLADGGSVILAANALELASMPAAEEVTLINTVPSVMRELLRLERIPGSVGVINLAGERLPQSLVEALHWKTPARRVLDLYGPTETTVYSTAALRRPDGTETIGRPIANERVFLLDPWLEPVPVGVPGEICIGGDGLARGYLNRPELTRERFIESPFQSGARLYRTGDFARHRADGSLEFLGRADQQVKLRGHRIELGEIESALEAHPSVAEAVAQVTGEDDPRLVAFVVSGAEEDAVEAGLRRHLRNRLPDYMMPSVFVVLPELPRTPNGKVDRKALSAAEARRSSARECSGGPMTPTEEALAEIWRELLGNQAAGVGGNFFDLGGHSLLVTRMVVRIRERFGVELPLSRVFEMPTIAGLAAEIEEALIGEISRMSEEEVRRISREGQGEGI